MSYGIEVFTTNGLENVANLRSLRLIGSQSYLLKPNSGSWNTYLMPISSVSDLRGPVYIAAQLSQFPNPPDDPYGSYDAHIRVHEEDAFWSNALLLPAEIRIGIYLLLEPAPSSYADIKLFALQG